MDEQYRNAIGTVESSNNYKALGPETDDGDRAYGRYQVMGNNIPEWTQRHLGKSMTPQEFLANPDAQDTVFNKETSAQYKKYGNLDDVTSTWFSGRPMAKAGNASDGYNTVPQYVSKVNAAYGGTPMQRAMRPSGTPMATPDDNPNGVLSSAPPPGPLSQTGFDWNRLGDTLINMAPGIAQDPDHAKVLAASAEANKKVATDKGTWSIQVLPNGQMVRINNKDGSPQMLPGNYAKPKDPGTDEYAKAYKVGDAKEMSDLNSTISKNALDARTGLSTIADLRQALDTPGLTQGATGELAQKARKLITAFGGGDADIAAAGDTASALSNRLALTLVNMGGSKLLPGSFSDSDRNFVAEMGTSLKHTKEANARMLDIFERAHNRTLELDALRGAHVKANDGMLMPSFRDEQNALNDKYVREDRARVPVVSTPPSAPTLPKGVKSIQIIQ